MTGPGDLLEGPGVRYLPDFDSTFWRGPYRPYRPYPRQGSKCKDISGPDGPEGYGSRGSSLPIPRDVFCSKVTWDDGTNNSNERP